MTRLDQTLLAAMVVLLAPSAGCGSDGPGTSVRVALAYDDALGLDTAEVTLGDRTESGPIAHQLLLLLTDDVAGQEMAIEVWGRRAAQRVAFGATTAVPQRGKTVSAQLSLTTCRPSCQGDMLMTCMGPAVSCALGCSENGDAHCLAPGTSNGVDPTMANALTGTTTFSASATLNTDTGEISGAISRPAGTGVNGAIGYFQAPAAGAGGAALGIFAFHNLAVEATGALHFTGARAAVLLVGDTAGISGTLDVTAGRGTRATPGPGGGAGGTTTAVPPGGCGPGGNGTRSGTDDGGGGGGGGSESGAPGGGITPPLAGVAGMPCLPMLLEPLQGGSGGGAGGPGDPAMTASGGGGGGALQVTALRVLVITGTINAGGAGGGGGAQASDAGGGAGGGSGGAILLEAPMLTIGTSAILAANGGGGGGGGGAIQPSFPGSGGAADSAFAQGGFGSLDDNGGGTGGALTSPPDVGRDGETNGNGGGGGGGSGRIVLRGRTRFVGGLVSPAPTQTDIKPPK